MPQAWGDVRFDAVRVAAAAVIGGTISEHMGGKFKTSSCPCYLCFGL